MNTDIRILLTLPDHKKTVNLISKLGEESFRCLVRLWTWAASHEPGGEITDYSIEYIEDAAKWKGEKGLFYSTLLEKDTRFLDKKRDRVTLHDWREHQPWVVGAKERRKQASNAANARWNKEKRGMQTAMRPAPDEQCSEHNAPNLTLPIKPSLHALRLATLLANKILLHTPKRYELRPAKKESTIDKWTIHIERLHKLNGYGWQEIDDVIVWCQNDSFWKSVILSGKKLRDKFDTLILKMQGSNSPQDKIQRTVNNIEEGLKL